MATNIKKTILRKKIDGIVYDLMVKTYAAMVYMDDSDSTTLLTKLTELETSVTENTQKLTTLIGDEGSGSIAEQIQTAITELKDSIVNEESPETIAYRLKAVETAITTINDGSTGILANAKTYTDQQIAAKISSTYKAAGSTTFAELPTLDSSSEGKVYNVTDEFTTNENFVEGAGKKYPAGTNVVCINTGDGVYKWDALTGVVDLSAYETSDVTDGKIATAKQEAIDAAAQDATTKANAAKSEAEQAAQNALNTYKEEVTAALSGKGRFIVSDSEPGDLSEYDLWAYIVPEDPEG